jgi:hypothetical protein
MEPTIDPRGPRWNRDADCAQRFCLGALGGSRPFRAHRARAIMAKHQYDGRAQWRNICW